MFSILQKFLRPSISLLTIGIILFLAPHETSAQLLFNKKYDIKNHHNDAKNIVDAFDDGYILSGTDYNDSIVGNLTYQLRYVAIYKLDCCGKVDWLIKYHPQGYILEVAPPLHIIKTFDSCYVVTGSILALTDSSWDSFLIKINRSGNIVWSKIIGHPSPFSDVLRSGIQNPDSTFTFFGVTAVIGSYEKVWMIKTDPSGNIIMEDSIGSNQEYIDVTGMVPAPDKGFIMCGKRQSNFNSYSNYYILKTDSNFKEQWHFAAGTVHGCVGISLFNDSLIFASGWFGATNYNTGSFLVKLNLNGTLLMGKSFTANLLDIIFTTQPVINADSTIVVGGEGNLETPAFSYSGFLFQTNFNGDSLQLKMFHKLKIQELYFLTKTKNNYYAACGYTGKSSPTVPGGIQDAWAFIADSLFNDSSIACAIPNSNYNREGSFLIYPQPAINSVTIKFPPEIKTDAIIISDVKGTIVYQITPSPFDQQTIYVNRNNLNAGIYLINYCSKGNWHYGCKILFAD